MNHPMAWTAMRLGLALLVLAGFVLAGCDTPPAPPETSFGGQVKSVSVNAADEKEVAAVQGFMTAYNNYEMSLKVLNAYYIRTGAYDQQRWTENEIKTLQSSRTWRFDNMQAPPSAEPQSVDNATEAGLVEQVAEARKIYKDSRDALVAFYKQRGESFKAALVMNADKRQDPVRQYDYFLNAEIPPDTLRPTEVVPAADDLFARALKLHLSGKPLPLITSYPKQREALGMFIQLVHEYPTSTKIAMSAYYIADIYKEYFNEDVRAVHWYQRAWEWDSHILKPARFQAAVVYDLRMQEPGKAVPLYRDVIKFEQFNQSNVDFAQSRLKKLTGAQ